MEKKVKVINLDGEVVKTESFTKDLLVEKIAKQAMFDTIIAENAAQRQGTHSTLTKAEVRGGGKKPWMQKHTGNARQGSTRNPQWVGGGVAFGPKPNRNYTKKVNRKVVHLAFRSALTEKVNNEELFVLVEPKMTKPSTKTINNMLKKMKIASKKVLFVLNEKTTNIQKSIANLPKANAKLFNQVSTRDLVNANYVILQDSTIDLLRKVYK